MTRTARIPPELTKRPFSLEDARRAGLTLSSLRGRAWRRLGAELYCWQGMREDPWLLLSTWRDLLPADAIFAGATAAWILGLDFVPTNPVEIVVPPGSGIRSRSGLSARRCQVPSCEVVIVRGLRATSLPRTLRDLCVRWTPVEALVAIDMSIQMGLTDAAALAHHAATTRGRAGASRLGSLVDVAAAAESPMESRLRWLLIQARLPRPEVQTDLYDSGDQFVGRADLYYPEARLVLEYDGGNHRERMVEDNRRQNLLVNAGFQILRFTAADIHSRPGVVVAQVRSALSLAPKRTTDVKRAEKVAVKRTVGAKRAKTGPSERLRRWWRRGRDLNPR